MGIYLRVGRTVGRTVYEGDTLVGVMDTRELAAEVVDAVNTMRADRDPHHAGWCEDGTGVRDDGRCEFCSEPIRPEGWNTP
jgi:hypothetical protein